MGKRHIGFDIWWPEQPASWGFLRRYLIPHPGTLIMTLLVVAGLLWAGSAGALPLRVPAAAGTSTGTIAYQGRLADSAGTPITDTVNMEFRLYDVAEGGTPLWEELWTGANAVRVSDGLFNVMLGSLNAIPQNVIAGHDQLWLGITVGTDDEMTPRVQLGSVPFAVQALTVPDGSITTNKIADKAVTSAKLGIGIYPFSRGGDAEASIIRYRGPTDQQTTLDVSACSERWCCNSANTICYYSEAGKDSVLAFNLEGANSISCTLLHDEDDTSSRSKGIYFATDGGNQSPLGTWTAFFSRDGVEGVPLNVNTGYRWICF